MERTRMMVGGMECICRLPSNICPVHNNINHIRIEHANTEDASNDEANSDYFSIDDRTFQPSRSSRVDRTRGRASKRRNTTSFIPYIRRMVHSHPETQDLSISSQAIQALNDLMHDVMHGLSTTAGEMSAKVKRKTLLPEDIEAASKIVLPTELFEMANMLAHQALTNFK